MGLLLLIGLSFCVSLESGVGGSSGEAGATRCSVGAMIRAIVQHGGHMLPYGGNYSTLLWGPGLGELYTSHLVG